MKIRADIAEYLRQGLNNAHIAELVGVHHSTVARARRRLRVPNVPRRSGIQAHERLFMEALPTGQVRDFGPTPKRSWTAKEQERHREELLAGLREGA